MENITFSTNVKPSSVWSATTDPVDKGAILGFLRGYNIEVRDKDGENFWTPCEYIEDEPEEYFNDDFHHWMYAERNLIPTGRIAFRGYFRETYNEEIGGYAVAPCDENGGIVS